MRVNPREVQKAQRGGAGLGIEALPLSLSTMSLLQRAVEWLSQKARPAPKADRKVFVSLHRGELKDNPEAAGMVALGLHEAMSHRQIACAIVDVDEWILRSALEDGRFRLIPESEAGKMDDFTGEPAWERERRADIGWLLANRGELIRAALMSGGDAQVIILLHSLDFMDLVALWGIKGRDDTCLLYYLGPNQPGLPGFACLPAAPKLAGNGFAFGDNPADDLVTWERLAKRIEGLLR